MFGNDRNAIRQQFISAWQKYRLPGSSLTPLEQMIGQLIAEHPEYHAFFEQQQSAILEAEFGADDQTNPFYHLGLHISLQEQLQTDRPAGIRDIYQQVSASADTPHTAEHKMIACLEKSLWDAQSKGVMPDENQYLESLKRLI